MIRNLFRLLFLILTAFIAACGVLPDRRSEDSGADFQQATWIGTFSMQLSKVETSAAVSVDPSKIQMMTRDSNQNLNMISNAAATWSLSSDFKTVSKFEFPVLNTDTKDVFTNGSQFLIVEKQFQMGDSLAQTADSLQSTTLDVMKFALGQTNGTAKGNIRVLYFLNKDIVFTVAGEVFQVSFSGANATIQKFPIPAIITNQIKLAKNISGGLSQSSHGEKVLWLQIEESFYWANSTDDAEYHWRGPYKLYANNGPPGRAVVLDQTFADSIEEVFKEMLVLREDGLYTVKTLTPSANSKASATDAQDPKTFFENNLKANFKSSCTNCHSAFSEFDVVTGEKRLQIADRLQNGSMPPQGSDEIKSLTPEMRGLMASWLRSLP